MRSDWLKSGLCQSIKYRKPSFVVVVVLSARKKPKERLNVASNSQSTRAQLVLSAFLVSSNALRVFSFFLCLSSKTVLGYTVFCMSDQLILLCAHRKLSFVV